MEGAELSSTRTRDYDPPSPIKVATDPEVYSQIMAPARPGEEKETQESRLDHIRSHGGELKHQLRVRSMFEVLKGLGKIAEANGPWVKQFEAGYGRTFKYDRNSHVMVIIQDKPLKREQDPPPPPAYVVTAYPLRNEAQFEQKRLKYQKEAQRGRVPATV